MGLWGRRPQRVQGGALAFLNHRTPLYLDNTQATAHFRGALGW